MYNFSFLNDFNENNVLLIFHNEKDNVENNIILPIIKICSPEIRAKYPERKLSEIFVALQYPDENSSDYLFNQFFDSPRCASMMYGSFKGCFVIDCSKYKTVKTSALSKLFNYINENSAPDFKFIVLFDENNEKDVIDFNDSRLAKSVKIVNLEIDLSLLETYKGKVEPEIYNFLIEEYNYNSSFRRLSSQQIEECVKLIINNNDDKKRIVDSFINNKKCERRIGF